MVFWVGGDGDCDFRSVGSQGPAEASREQVGKSLVPHPGVAWGLGVADGQRRLEVIICPPPSYLVPTCGPYSCSLLSPRKSLTVPGSPVTHSVPPAGSPSSPGEPSAHSSVHPSLHRAPQATALPSPVPLLCFHHSPNSLSTGQCEHLSTGRKTKTERLVTA